MPDVLDPPSFAARVSKGQKVSVAVFVLGLVAFFGTGMHVLRQHSDWSDFACPPGVSDIFLVLGATTLAVGGALGVSPRQLWHAWSGTYTARAEDKNV